MEKDKIKSMNRIVKLTRLCEKEYKKLRRSQPALLTIVNSKIEAIGKNPKIGEEMVGDLQGFRSVHIDEFDFRIVYRIESSRILVCAIRNRKDVYKEMARRIAKPLPASDL